MNLAIKLFFGCLLTLAVFTARLSCQDHDGAQSPELLDSTTERPAPVAGDSVASRLRAAFFKLIDFKSFKTKFNKHYGSLTEEVARHKLFLARHLKAKLSMAAYQLGLITSHLGINRMSDWTQAERERLKNKLDARKLPKHRKRRSVGDEDETETVTVKPMSEAEAQRIGAIKDVSLLDRGVGIITKAFKKVTGGSNSKRETTSLDESDRDHQVSYGHKGGVRVDLRKTKCFNKPRHQGLCGSCYAFAALAQYEFMYCLAYGKKIKFSEQFIVDCGPEHLQMSGCEGGTVEQVAQFAHVLGLQKHSDYPYTAEQGQCSISSTTSGEEASTVYAKTKSSSTLVASNLNEFEHWLERQVPLYVSFGMDDSSFYDYAGGIDNPTSCDTTGHAMLVVGVGSDDKHGDYFILRNSMGTDWGRSGYYHVYKKAPCWRFGGSGWAPEGLRDRGKNAFSGVKSKRRQVDDNDVQPPVVHVPRQEPEAHEVGHYNFDSDDEEDHMRRAQDYEDVSQERTWSPAPPPSFEWKPIEHAPTYNPYEGLESRFEYNFDNDNDVHLTGGRSDYYDAYSQQESSNGYDNYASYFDRYDFGPSQNDIVNRILANQ